MAKKSEAGETLKLFCREFGVPQKLVFDGSKEQSKPGTVFMQQIRRHDIDYHVIEPDLHNQNPCEGVIRVLRRKWYRVIVHQHVPRRLWDYGYKWVTEICSLTYTTAGNLNDIPLSQVTGETVDISEYLDFGFMTEFGI